MKYATICSGIGAPEAAWADIWGPPVFTSEIEPFPSAVLKHHMPDVPNYGDMTKYKEWPDHELDVLIGGTPCQSFSVAGLRRSLEDDRGNLTITFLGLVRRYQPRFTVWENVPGVLNTPDNAFGQFISGLVGFDSELHPTGGRWTSAGFVIGPERVAAWRILNAEHFGVPQRRRRVFVIASPRDMGFASCQILFEPEGVQGNIKKGGEAGEDVASYTPSNIGGYSEGCGTLRAEGGDCGGGSETIIAKPLLSHGGPQGRHNPTDENYVVFTQEQEPKREGGDKKAHTLGTYNGRKQCVAINARQDPISIEDKALPLDQKGNTQTVAIQDGREIDKHQNGLGIDEGGPSYTIDQTGAQAVAFTQNQCGDVLTGKVMPSMGTNQNATGRNTPKIHTHSIVRRLTPMECERLQGFPDGYTLIPHRGKPAPDGPRYKALGNSMAVPVVRWIGRRIQMWEDLNK